MEPNGLPEFAARLRAQVGRVVVGLDEPVELITIALLARGHVLLEGPPGVAKTLLVRTVARSLGLEFRRIQFTPDLMPGDIIGTNLFDFRTNEFRLTRGALFTEFLLADEINRTPPKTQAALLEAMQERAVTLDGTTHALGDDFVVVATENPIEHEGTYPLPEAQLDRFLFKVVVGYPSRDHERELARRHGAGGESGAAPDLDRLGIAPVVTREDLAAARAAVATVRLEDPVLDYAVDLVRATREHPMLALGASPRAAAMLCSASRGAAALAGREFVIPDDVKRLAEPLISHRVVLAAGAELEGATTAGVIASIIDQVAAPR